MKILDDYGNNFDLDVLNEEQVADLQQELNDLKGHWVHWRIGYTRLCLCC
jgi:hypothetical protein